MEGRLELLVAMVRIKMKTKLLDHLSLSNIILKESFNSWVFFLSISELTYYQLCPFF